MADEEEARIEKEHEFLDSAKSFQWDAVKTMLRETPDLINVQPCGRWTALHQAAFEGNGDVAKELLDLGADPSATNRAGQSPADVAKGPAKKVLAAPRGGDAEEAAAGEAPAGEAAAPAEPPAKKAKKAKVVVYNMNINEAVDKEYEYSSLAEISKAPTSALQGIANRGRDILKKFGVKTVRDLGKWKFYRMAKAITGLSELESKGNRKEGATLNANQALDKKHECKSLEDIVKLPPSALQGLAGWADDDLAKLHIKTIKALGEWKFARWAEWITDLAEFED